MSRDGEAGAIILELESSNSDESVAVLRALEAALEPYEEIGFKFHIVGQTAQFAITDEALAADSARLTVPMVLLVAIVILLLFRSWQSGCRLPGDSRARNGLDHRIARRAFMAAKLDQPNDRTACLGDGTQRRNSFAVTLRPGARVERGN